MKKLAAALLVVVAIPVTAQVKVKQPFSVVEATIPEMQEALRTGRTTSREIVTQSLLRIAMYEDRLNAVMTVNRQALEEADRLDRERAAGRIRGPLHGIPVALKDNIHTTNMPTTGGALAFDGLVPPYEATLTKNLRDGGAIILAKTSMTELANWVSSTGMPTNYSSLNGYTFNPYDARRDLRAATGDGRPALATGGSSSGVGTAVSFWAANVGTETSGSILSPSNQNMLAGIKPTVGRISRHGIIPITADQDTAGPMARSVTDAAIMLGVLEGAAPDPKDTATTSCAPPRNRDYTVYLKRDGLKGARIGIPRAFYYEKFTPPGATEPRGGLNADQLKGMEAAIAAMKAAGAVIVDPANIPSVVDADPENNYLNWGICTSMDALKARKCSIDFAYGMERDFNAWLRSLGDAAPVKTLQELREWNEKHEKLGTLKYGQGLLDFSSAMDRELFQARYEADRARDIHLSATHGIDAVMKEHRLDALIFFANYGASIAARPGYPTVMVPGGTVPNAPSQAFPAGFNAKPSPFGVSFTGMACSEPTLLRLAYAFEQATK
ncbi:MAG TPA: amidase family protein, partial [Thermoanaerobaculia bacterium]|nr:amidase family protein [Thermoanaerobaculia bacterium]